jgi:hypothetical protein
MPALFLARLAVRPPAPPRAAVEAVLFVATLAVLAGVVWGRVRTTGPAALAAFTVLAALIGALDRAAAARRVGVLLATVFAAALIRELGSDVAAHRASRMALVAGLAVAVGSSLPAALLDRFRRIATTIAADPGGRTAVGVALFGVAVPAAGLFALTTPCVVAGDTMPVVPTVVRTLTAGTRDLSPFVESPPGRWAAFGPGTPYFVRPGPAGGWFSSYPAGMEVFAGPAVVLGAAAGCDLADDAVLLWIEKLTAAAMTGGSLGLFFLVAVRVGPPAAAFAVVWLLATGSVFTTTLGMLLWQQGGVVFWSLVVLLIEFAGGRRWVVQGVACGLMLACRPSAVTFLLPFGLWVLARDRRRGLLVPAVAALAYLPWAVLYQSLYGSPLGPTAVQAAADWSPLAHFAGVLVSPGRGLLVYQPLLWLLPIWAACRGPAGGPWGWPAFALLTAGCHLALVSSWPVWWGGACYGSRLAAEAVPPLALLAVRPVAWLLTVRGGPAVLVAVGLLGAAVHAPCAAYQAWVWNVIPAPVDQHPERLWDWSDAPFRFLGLPPG